MRKILSHAVALAVAVSIAAGAQQPRKKRVAVFDFDYGTVHGGIAAIFGQDVDVGRGVGDLLVTTLVKDGTYSVIERSALDRVLREQNFSNSDRADATTAARIGKLLGVDAIIVGSITQFGNDTKNTGIGGGGGALSGFGLGGFQHSRTKAIVALTARIVDIDTAEILAVAEGRGESKRESTSLLGGGGSWHGWGGAGVNFGSSDFQQTIIGEAVKAAVDNTTAQIVEGAEKLHTRQVLVQGLVAAVEQGQIVLNIGTKAGLACGDTLNVERVSREVKDPVTGNVIRRIAMPIGVVRIAEADDISAVAVVVSGNGFKVGDVVKTIQR